MSKLFSNNIDFLRKKAGFTQLKLATALSIKRNTLSNYITEHSEPNIETIIGIASFFGISVDQLLKTDLQNVQLNKNEVIEDGAKDVQLNVQPNVQLNKKKAQKEPCQECIIKDSLIGQKDQLIALNTKLIASQEAQISLLQNKIDIMQFERREAAESQYTPKEDRKTV